MSKMIAIAAMGVAAVGLVFAGLALWSHYGPAALRYDGSKLAPCGASPNCVCSEVTAAAPPASVVEPLMLPAGDRAAQWLVIRSVVQALAGEIVEDSGAYLHATFVTPIMRYKDDVELCLDDDRIHIRSASRVGYSDLGANRKRVARLTDEFGAALNLDATE